MLVCPPDASITESFFFFGNTFLSSRSWKIEILVVPEHSAIFLEPDSEISSKFIRLDRRDRDLFAKGHVCYPMNLPVSTALLITSSVSSGAESTGSAARLLIKYLPCPVSGNGKAGNTLLWPEHTVKANQTHFYWVVKMLVDR